MGLQGPAVPGLLVSLLLLGVEGRQQDFQNLHIHHYHKLEDGAQLKSPAANVRAGENTLNSVELSQGLDLHRVERHRRGIISGIITTTAILTQLASLGFTITGAVTDGCAFKPSICEEKKAIEDLGKQIQSKKGELQEKYDRNRVDYLKVRQASIKNKEILYYLDEAFQKMNDIEAIDEDINSLFMAQYPKLHQMFKTNDSSIENYIEQTLTPLEYRLEDLKKMIENVKKSAIIGLVVEYLAEIVMRKLIKVFTTSYNNVKYDIESAEGYRLFLKEVLSGDEEATEKFLLETKESWKQKSQVDNPSKWKKMKRAMSWKRTKERFKLTGKVLGNLKLRLNQYVRKDLPHKAKLWWRVLPGTKTGSWKGFKGKMRHHFIKPVKAKFDLFKTKVTKPISTLKKVKLGWAGGITTFLGAAGDIINMAVQAHEWSKVAKEMEKAKQNFQYYLGNLTLEIAKVDAEYDDLTKTWDEQIENFPEITDSLTWFIKNISRYEKFGLLDPSTPVKLPVDVELELFGTSLDDVTRNNLEKKQKAVKEAIVAFHYNMSTAFNAVYSRYILYSQLTTKVNELLNTAGEESLADLYSSLKVVYSYQPDQVKEFGQELRDLDLLCGISVLYSDMETFDFYSLGELRPSCNVTTTEFVDMKYQAQRLRIKTVMMATVKRMVQENKPVTNILDEVKHDYRSKEGDFATYGNTLTDKNILCAIAKAFPARAHYDFYTLGDFRPSCPSDGDFRVLKTHVETLKRNRATVAAMITAYNMTKFFYCDMTTFGASVGISESEARMLITDVDPTLTEICPQACFDPTRSPSCFPV